MTSHVPLRERLFAAAFPTARLGPFVVATAVVAVILLGACSDTEDSPDTTATAASPTPAQTASDSSRTPFSQRIAPTPVPQVTLPANLPPVGLADVTADHLSGMGLIQDSIAEELDGLTLTSRSGPLNGDAVAGHTVDPDDTGATLSSLGYVGGYETSFTNPTVPFLVTASSRTYLWKDEDAARGFIDRQLADAERLSGTEISEGVDLVDAEEYRRPDLGSDARAGLLTGYVKQLDRELTTTYLFWRRGPIVASVALLAFDGVDRTEIVARLAAVMDLRIDGVLAGDIAAASPPPVATPVPEAVSAEGFDVPAMVPTLEDVPANATLQGEGASPGSGALQAYFRRFISGDSPMRLGESEASEIEITVGLHSSPEVAAITVQVIGSLDADGLGGLFRQGFAGGAGLSPTNISAEPIDFPRVGDASTALVLRLTTGSGDLETYLVYFSRGRVRAQLSVVGQVGSLRGRDLVQLAGLIDERIRRNSP